MPMTSGSESCVSHSGRLHEIDDCHVSQACQEAGREVRGACARLTRGPTARETMREGRFGQDGHSSQDGHEDPSERVCECLFLSLFLLDALSLSLSLSASLSLSPFTANSPSAHCVALTCFSTNTLLRISWPCHSVQKHRAQRCAFAVSQVDFTRP